MPGLLHVLYTTLQTRCFPTTSKKEENPDALRYSTIMLCKACGISSRARKYGITFHRFPKDKTQRYAWIDFVEDKGFSTKLENFNYAYLCSLHFDSSCFDKTSTIKIRLKPFSVPTIHISRSKYDRISTTVTAITAHMKTERANKISPIDIMATNTLTDAATLDVTSNIDISTILKKSTANNTLQIDKSQLIEEENINMKSEPSNKNDNMESLSFTNLNMFGHKTDVSFQTSPSNTSKKVILKNKIVSMGLLLSEKSNTIRKLQKQIFNLKSIMKRYKIILHYLCKKNLITSDNIYTLMQEFGLNEQLTNRLLKKIR